jgi:hypothetical protein
MVDFELFHRDYFIEALVAKSSQSYLKMHIFMRIVWITKEGILSITANILE